MDAHRLGFFRLPLELRSRVYREYFDAEDNMIKPFLSIYPTSILRTCQQVYQEAIAVLYGQHTIFFSDKRRLQDPYFISVRHPCLVCNYRDRQSGQNKQSSDSTHDFHVINCSYARLAPWIAGIGPKNASLIRSLKLHFWHEAFLILPEVYVTYAVSKSNKERKKLLSELTCQDMKNGALLLKTGLNMLSNATMTGLKRVNITFTANLLADLVPYGTSKQSLARHVLTMEQFSKIFFPGLAMRQALETRPAITDQWGTGDGREAFGMWEWKAGAEAQPGAASDAITGSGATPWKEGTKADLGIRRWSRHFIEQGVRGSKRTD